MASDDDLWFTFTCLPAIGTWRIDESALARRRLGQRASLRPRACSGPKPSDIAYPRNISTETTDSGIGVLSARPSCELLPSRQSSIGLEAASCWPEPELSVGRAVEGHFPVPASRAAELSSVHERKARRVSRLMQGRPVSQASATSLSSISSLAATPDEPRPRRESSADASAFEFHDLTYVVTSPAAQLRPTWPSSLRSQSSGAQSSTSPEPPQRGATAASREPSETSTASRTPATIKLKTGLEPLRDPDLGGSRVREYKHTLELCYANQQKKSTAPVDMDERVAVRTSVCDSISSQESRKGSSHSVLTNRASSSTTLEVPTAPAADAVVMRAQSQARRTVSDRAHSQRARRTWVEGQGTAV
eukprot:m.445490 g.445490  ORF g.445490 m.445490 type:complete len:362 (-) comp56853_c0_seq3:459-1544(-)